MKSLNWCAPTVRYTWIFVIWTNSFVCGYFGIYFWMPPTTPSPPPSIDTSALVFLCFFSWSSNHIGSRSENEIHLDFSRPKNNRELNEIDKLDFESRRSLHTNSYTPHSTYTQTYENGVNGTQSKMIEKHTRTWLQHRRSHHRRRRHRLCRCRLFQSPGEVELDATTSRFTCRIHLTVINTK